MPDFSTYLFDTTASLETYKRFDSLSSLSDPESPIPDIIAPPPPTAATSPIVQGSMKAKGKATKAALNHPLRILVMNYQSIKNKNAELHTIIKSAKSDIILGNESEVWFKKTQKFSQILLMWFGKTEQVMPMVVSLLLLSVTCSVLKLRYWTPTVK